MTISQLPISSHASITLVYSPYQKTEGGHDPLAHDGIQRNRTIYGLGVNLINEAHNGDVSAFRYSTNSQQGDRIET